MRIKNLSIALCISLVLSIIISGCVIIKEDKIVGTVNGEKITETQYNYMLQTVKQQMENEANKDNITNLWDTEIEGQSATDVAKDKALESAVKNKVEMLKAKEIGLTLDAEDRKNISMQKKSLMDNVGGREAYNKQLKEMGFTENSFTDFLESLILSHKLFTKITEEGAEYTITDEEISQNYEENKEDYKNPDRIRAKHILINTVDEEQQPLSEEEKEEAKLKAEEIYEKVKAGENFDQLMNENSQDPGLAENPKGYTFGPGEMVPEFEEAAFALEIGGISDIVESDFGYHIIKLEEEIKGEYAPLDDQLKEGIENIVIRKKYDDVVETWKKEADIKTNSDVLKSIKVKED